MSNLKNSKQDTQKINAVLNAVKQILLNNFSTSDEKKESPLTDAEKVINLKHFFNQKQNEGIENYAEIKPIHLTVFNGQKTETERVKELNGVFNITLNKDTGLAEDSTLIEKSEEKEAENTDTESSEKQA